MLGIDKGSLIRKAMNLRHRGVPLKRFVLNKTDYSSLKEFAELFLSPPTQG